MDVTVAVRQPWVSRFCAHQHRSLCFGRTWTHRRRLGKRSFCVPPGYGNLTQPSWPLKFCWGLHTSTRMSQEVSKWLVKGLQPQYTPFISRLQPIYKPFTNFLGHPSSRMNNKEPFVSWSQMADLICKSNLRPNPDCIGMCRSKTNSFTKYRGLKIVYLYIYI